MESRLKYVLAVLLVIAGVLVFKIYSRRVKVEAGPSTAVATEEAAPAGTPAPAGGPNPAAPTPVPAPTDAAGVQAPAVTATPAEETFKQALARCWGQAPASALSDATDLDDLAHSIDREGTQNQIMYENYHLHSSQGERRLQVLYQENVPVEARVFEVDGEGLPIPEMPSPQDRFRSVQDTIQAHLGEGTIFFHQIHRQILVGKGISGEMDTVDDKTTELQLYGLPGGTLLCSAGKCECSDGKVKRITPDDAPTQ